MAEIDKKLYIEKSVEKIKNNPRIGYLFPEDINTLKEKAFDMFLKDDIDINEIDRRIIEIITERIKKEKLRKIAEDLKQPTTDKITSSIDDEINNAGMVHNSIDTNSNGKVTSAVGKLLTTAPPKTVNAVSDLLNKLDNNPVIQPEVLNSYETIVPTPAATESNNELDSMMEESKEIKQEPIVNENTINKQYVKTNNNDKQSGFVSIFNIVLALLGVTAFILAAMILNLLLK